jgi:hypothetical protein
MKKSSKGTSRSISIQQLCREALQVSREIKTFLERSAITLWKDWVFA